MAEDFIQIIIVDDEQDALTNLQHLLESFSQVQILAKISNPETAVAKISELKPDIIFLDIEMPIKSGFAILCDLYQSDIKPEAIFVTAFDKYAIEAIRHAAFDFLVKPVNMEDLKNAIDRYSKKKKETNKDGQIKRLLDSLNKPDKIKINTTGGFTLIRPEDIIYIEADWNYSDIYFGRENIQIVTTNIGELQFLLPMIDFFRLTRSIIINVKYLTKVNRKKRLAILIKEGEEYCFKVPLLNIRKLERFFDDKQQHIEY
jgi:two-component system, LytTR family, response regulator